MAGFWARLFGRTREVESRGSSDVARERLQFILVHDRIHLPPERMEMMKQEILAVLRKYIEVEGDTLDIAFQKHDNNSLLVAQAPFHKPVSSFESDEYDPAHDDA